MKTKKRKSIEFIKQPESLTKLSMNEIKGGRSVATYMGCGQHHDETEVGSRLMSVV